MRGGVLIVDGVDGGAVLRAPDRRSLAEGVEARQDGHTLSMQLDGEVLRVEVDGRRAPREAELGAPPSRSAWAHAFIALAGSAAGFVAGLLYLLKAQDIASAWALKMAYHTAGWHLLLTLTLFPASVWGQRLGIRAVQLISAIFFAIHVGIAIANVSAPDSAHDGAIGFAQRRERLAVLAFGRVRPSRPSRHGSHRRPWHVAWHRSMGMHQQILIIGGGTAGITVASRLTRRGEGAAPFLEWNPTLRRRV